MGKEKITRIIIKETDNARNLTIDFNLYNVSALEAYAKLLELEKIGDKK